MRHGPRSSKLRLEEFIVFVALKRILGIAECSEGEDAIAPGGDLAVASLNDRLKVLPHIVGMSPEVE